VPLNVFNKTVYVIYSLNNLCLFSLSLTKKNILTFVMLMLFTCVYLPSVFILLQFACCVYQTCSSVCNYSHVFLCFSRYTVVCPVCISHHSCTWLGINLFDSKYSHNFIYFYIMYYSWHVLYPTYCFYCGFMEL